MQIEQKNECFFFLFGLVANHRVAQISELFASNENTPISEFFLVHFINASVKA